MKAEITLPGRPITKKNHKMIATAISKTGKKYKRPISSETYQKYATECLWRLKSYRGPKFTGPVHVKALYWMPDRRGWPDLLGLEESTADILQEAGIIANDRDIVSWDGSRIIGIDKDNPRVEIEIEGVEG